ncbi:MAG: class I SAM-dependent methyltransferase [Gammaproteobacteria bacterium]|nr:class I SAM-dependent methyltransferase [Gammaproteobacteria bacterium]
MHSSQNSENLRYHASDPAYSGKYDVVPPPVGHRLRPLVKTYIPKKENGDCIEIGCSPGGFLTLFGDLGYTLHGIDFDPRIQNELPQWLIKNGYKPGEFIINDFTIHSFAMQYDVVYSLGFIEHFTNWADILLRQADLVKEGGYLLIGTPNYAGFFQRLLHKLFENENYMTHVTLSMNPELWRNLLEAIGFRVIFAGTVGAFDLWTRGTETLPRITQELLWTVEKLRPTLSAIEESSLYAMSPYLAIVAQREIAVLPSARYADATVRAGFEPLLAQAKQNDRRTEELATTVVTELENYLRRRACLTTLLKDKLRRLLTRS